MSRAPVVLDFSFVQDCLHGREIRALDRYQLKDTNGERRYGIRLSAALERAKQLKGHLLQGQQIVVVEDIPGGFDTYQSIIHANGGKCLSFRARAGANAPITRDRHGTPIESDSFVYLVSGEASVHKKVWSRFGETVEAAGREPRIVRSDWVLDMALSQQIQSSDDYEIDSTN